MGYSWLDTQSGFAASLGPAAVSIPRPAPAGGLAVGDVLLGFMSTGGSGGATWTAPATGPAWVEVIDTVGSAFYHLKITDSTVLAAVNAVTTFDFVASNTGLNRNGTITAYRGLDISNLIDGSVQFTTHNQPTPLCPAVTTTANGDMIFQANHCGNNSNPGGITEPAGTTKRYQAGNAAGFVSVGDLQAGAAGTYGFFTWGESASASNWCSMTAAFRVPPQPVTTNHVAIPIVAHPPARAVAATQDVGLNHVTIPMVAHTPAATASATVGLQHAAIPITGHPPSAAMRLQKHWDARRGVYAATGLETIVCVGDSITELFYSGPNARYSDGWIPRLSTIYRTNSGSPNHPALYLPAATGASSALAGWVYPEGSDPWTRHGNVLQKTNTHGLGLRAAAFINNGDYIEVAAPTWATHATFCYAGNGGNELVDIKSNGVTVGSDNIPYGDDAEHTKTVTLNGSGNLVRITMASGSFGNLLVGGVLFEDRTAGTSRIRLVDAGHAGIQAKQYAGGDGTNYPNAEAWSDAVAVHEPDLVILTIGVNDAQQGTAGATFQTYVQTMVNMIDASCTALSSKGVPAILFVIYPYCDVTAVNPSGFYSTTLWAAYRTAINNVAAGMPFARADVIDLQAVGAMPAQSGPSAYTVDGVHPNATTGPAAIAQALAARIDPLPQNVILGFAEIPIVGHPPAAAPGPVSVTTLHASIPVTAHAPAVTPGAITVQAQHVAIPITGHPPAATPGPVTITSPHAAIPITPHQMLVGTGAVFVGLQHVSVPITAHAPAAAPGVVSVALNHAPVPIQGHPPAAAPGPVTITAPHTPIPIVGHPPAAAPGPVTVELEHVQLNVAAPAHGVQPGPVTVSAPHVAIPIVAHPPAVAPGATHVALHHVAIQIIGHPPRRVAPIINAQVGLPRHRWRTQPPRTRWRARPPKET